MKFKNIDIVSLIIGAAIILIIISCIGCFVNENRIWNNGYCQCGGRWQYMDNNIKIHANGEDVYANSEYIYRCDRCGKMRSFSQLR